MNDAPLGAPIGCQSMDRLARTRSRTERYGLTMDFQGYRRELMRRVLLILALMVASASHAMATFSIVAIDPATGDLGVAVASRYFAVGTVVPWAEANVGAVATQAEVNVGYGPKALELLRQGLTAPQVEEWLLAEDTFPNEDGRQFAIVDSKGNVVTHTGPNAPHWAGGKKGASWAAQGNILVGPLVPE